VGYIRDMDRKPTGGTSDADLTIRAILAWVRSQPDLRAVALVGSHTRATARPASDIDLVLLARDPDAFRADTTWVDQIDWQSIGTHPQTWVDEDYGAAWSRRVWLDREEVELTFADLSWANVNPVDAGTRQVILGGCQILHDPDGLLARLCNEVSGSGR
jgi:hypothetical protein